MQTYVDRRKTAATRYDRTPNTSSVTAARQAINSLPHSSDADSSVPNLEAQMHQRIQAQFLTHQIPAAEQEADALSRGIGRVQSPAALKTTIGQKLGADFSDVRFHAGPEAEARANAIGARAYTSGQDVYFGTGDFESGVAAHELIHTVQQGAVESAVSTVSAPEGGVQMKPLKAKKPWYKRALDYGVNAVGSIQRSHARARDDFVTHEADRQGLSKWEKFKLFAQNPIALAASKTASGKAKTKAHLAQEEEDQMLALGQSTAAQAPPPGAQDAPEWNETASEILNPVSAVTGAIDTFMQPASILADKDAGKLIKESAGGKWAEKAVAENAAFEGIGNATGAVGLVSSGLGAYTNIHNAITDSSTDKLDVAARSVTEGGNVIGSALDFASGFTGKVASSGLGHATNAISFLSSGAQLVNASRHVHMDLNGRKEADTLLEDLETGDSTRNEDGKKHDAYMMKMAQNARNSSEVHVREGTKDIIDSVIDIGSTAASYIPGYGQVVSGAMSGVKAVVDLGLSAHISQGQKDMREGLLNTDDNEYDTHFAAAFKAIGGEKEGLNVLEKNQLENRAKHIAMQQLYGKGVKTRKEGAMRATQKHVATMEGFAKEDPTLRAHNAKLGLKMSDGTDGNAAGTYTNSLAAAARFNSDVTQKKSVADQLTDIQQQEREKYNPIAAARERDTNRAQRKATKAAASQQKQAAKAKASQQKQAAKAAALLAKKKPPTPPPSVTGP